MKTKPCDQCPWRLKNQGKKHKFGFYTKANLKRLWNQIRRGGGSQSCHLTDPSHPDHVAAGAKAGAVAQECPGSVIVVLQEIRKMADEKGVINTSVPYLKSRKKGLTKNGILWWVVSRMKLGGVPFMGGPKLPDVDESDPEIGLPEELREG